MQRILQRTRARGWLQVQSSPTHLSNANNRLAKYNLEIRDVPLPNLQHRPIELLEAAGTATITSLEPAALTLERRVASHWAIVKYIADLEVAGGYIGLSVDGQRYKKLARGALSGDLGVAWSALAALQHLLPNCLFLDVDHAGSKYVDQPKPVSGTKSRSRPDFVALPHGGAPTAHLFEAKGSTRALDGRGLAHAARQLFRVDGVAPNAVGRRFVTTVHGSHRLTAAVYEVAELPGTTFDPSGGDPSFPARGAGAGEDIIPEDGAEFEEPAEDDRPLDDRFVDGLQWFSGQAPAFSQSPATEWSTAGRRFQGLESVTQLGPARLVVRQGVAVDILEAVRDRPAQALLHARDTRRALVAQVGAEELDVTETATGAFVGSARSAAAIGDFGTILEVESNEG